MPPSAHITNGFENSREKIRSIPPSVPRGVSRCAPHPGCAPRTHAPQPARRRDYSRALLAPRPAACTGVCSGPMSTAPPATQTAPAEGLVRGLGLLDATTLIVGSVIGSGIFVAPSIMAGYVQDPAMLLGLWVVGGILTLFGALAYGELAAAMPRAGGQYVFLKEAFSPLWGFLYGWTFLLAINTGFIAAVGVAFAKYLGVFLPAIGEGTVLF